jgi:hypothetical protein
VPLSNRVALDRPRSGYWADSTVYS